MNKRREDLKRWLRSLRDLIEEERQIKLELDRVEAMMGPRSSGVGSSGGCSGDPMLNVVSQHLALQERYRQKLQEVAAEQVAFEDMIAELDPLSRMLMRYRYLDGMMWEEVCAAINYSMSQTHWLHAKALDNLKKNNLFMG